MPCRLYLVFAFVSLLTAGYSQSVSPHPVPEEFASDYYVVTVNGQSVPVFHAGLNVYFASFEFVGNASVAVTSNANTDKYSGQTSNKEAVKIDEKGYWRGMPSCAHSRKIASPRLMVQPSALRFPTPGSTPLNEQEPGISKTMYCFFLPTGLIPAYPT
ncbi:hypothetical protein DYU11_17325 [Fibrisoma montanum]|uniref:Uncharacterized protein n=1 Tax=Fibrisoma montanum TaxID=2305895 RepID=A0A418M5I8_9BACT|nr:hypothetical protein DYU11_17325 [Fibrisoma montanum]